MLEHLALIDQLDRPDLESQAKRQIISIIDRMRNSNYLLPHERDNYEIKRAMVLEQLDRTAA